MRPIDEITRDVIGIAMQIHSQLGPGLFESVYEAILEGKLLEAGYRIDRQKPVEVMFEGKCYGPGFKLDLLIDQRLVVEVKSVERPSVLHAAQLLTYLRLLELPVGLIINFNGTTLKQGIKRVVNDHSDSNFSASSATSG